MNPRHLAPICLLLIVFASCKSETDMRALENTSVEGSIDWAKTNEVGSSSILYKSKEGTNEVMYTEWYGRELGKMGYNSVDWSDSIPYQNNRKPVDGYFGIGAGIGFVGKGAKLDNFTLPLEYLEIPVMVSYHYPVGPGQLFGRFGPYFAYGIGGKVDGVSVYGENNGGFKHFDAGLGLRVGYQLDMGLSLAAGYEYGLANIEYADQDVTGHNRSFSINVGYNIGRLFAKVK
jgi:hypothetical protein